MIFSYEELVCSTDTFTTLIGEGAFGSVYLGKDLRGLGTRAAVKVLTKVRDFLVLLAEF